jgi:uncharacterized protein involved in exopolysaccharide biosynthesis
MEEIQNNPIDPLKVLWSEKWALLLFTLVVTGTSFFVSSYLPKQYQVKATVLVSPPQFNVKKQEAGSLSIAFYRDLAMTSGVLQGVIDRLVPKYPNIKSSLYPTSLKNMIAIDLGPEEFRVGAPKSAVMNIKVTGQRDPLLLRDIANTLTDLLSEVSGQIKKSKMQSIADSTNTLFISIKKRLSEAEKTLKTIRAENKLPSLAAELSRMKDRLDVNNYELTMIEGQINTESAKLKAYKEIKSELPKFMKTDIVRAEISIKTLLAKKELLTKSIKQLKKRIPLLKNKTRAMRLKEKQISRKIIALEEQFLFLFDKAQKTRIAEFDKTSDMRVISKAIEPRFPVWPDRFKIVLITLVFSLVVGMVAALAKEHLDMARQNAKK